MNLADAMERAQVLDFELQKQLVPLMKDLVPLPGIYDPAFIAANQAERADNCIKGSKSEQVRGVWRVGSAWVVWCAAEGSGSGDVAGDASPQAATAGASA
jgi:hypothetical protein